MKVVPFRTNSFTEDTHFIVDDEDFDRVSRFGWRLSRGSRRRKTARYDVVRDATKEERDAGSPRLVYASRFILWLHISYAKIGEEVDHRNRDVLDNRRSNLRICSRHINQRNKSNNSGVGRGLWGATYNKALKSINKWQANFHIKGKTYMVGSFSTEIEAHNKAVEKFEEITGVRPAF